MAGVQQNFLLAHGEQTGFVPWDGISGGVHLLGKPHGGGGQLFHAQGRGLHVGLRGKAGCIILGAPQSAHPGIDPHRRGAHMQHPGGKACLFAVHSPHNALHQPNQADQNGRRGSQLTKAEG